MNTNNNFSNIFPSFCRIVYIYARNTGLYNNDVFSVLEKFKQLFEKCGVQNTENTSSIINYFNNWFIYIKDCILREVNSYEKSWYENDDISCFEFENDYKRLQYIENDYKNNLKYDIDKQSDEYKLYYYTPDSTNLYEILKIYTKDKCSIYDEKLFTFFTKFSEFIAKLSISCYVNSIVSSMFINLDDTFGQYLKYLKNSY